MPRRKPRILWTVFLRKVEPMIKRKRILTCGFLEDFSAAPHDPGWKKNIAGMPRVSILDFRVPAAGTSCSNLYQEFSHESKWEALK